MHFHHKFAVTMSLTASIILLTACGQNQNSTLPDTNAAATGADVTAETASGTAEGASTSASDGTEATGESAEAGATADPNLPDTLEEGEVEMIKGAVEGSFLGAGPGEDSSAIADFFTANPDATARLVIPDTDIAYTIIAGDSSTGSADSAESSTTALTIDPGNTPDFSDPNTVLYANDADLSGFLHYADPDYFTGHPYLYIEKPGMVIEYGIFAAYNGDGENILVKHDCYDIDNYYAYIDEIYATRSMTANFNTDLVDTVKNSWQLLTIVTPEMPQTLLVQAAVTGIQKIGE